MDFLETIARERLERVRGDLGQVPIRELRERIEGRRGDSRPFQGALRRSPGEPLRVIAEVKRASPSAGVLQKQYDPVALASAYETAGAAAISVLTEPNRFGGSIMDLERVRGVVGVPVLLKDFVVHERQIYEARASGADAALLIVGLLSPTQLQDYAALALGIGLDPLIEIHEPSEIDRALAVAGAAIGINNRDLRTLAMRRGWAETLLPRIPADRVRIAESGYSSREEAERLGQLGCDAVLVGESLLRSDSPGEALQTFLGAKETGEERSP